MDDETTDEKTDSEGDGRPSTKVSIHGHPVYCDDYSIREYLRHLDNEEAKVIFEYAKHHGSSAFEYKKGGTRTNATMEYDNGAYIIRSEGAESGSSWF